MGGWRQSMYLNPSGGNVGIGTMNPLARLHVAGDARFDGNITATTINGNAILTPASLGSLNVALAGSQLAIGNVNFKVATTGKVGIGSSTLGYDLSFGNQSDRTIGLDRTTGTTFGKNLTISAGGAPAGSTDKLGGSLILSSGTATGHGSSTMEFRTASIGANGTADNAPQTRMKITEYGAVGIGSGALTSTYWDPFGGLDISYGGVPSTLMLGADSNTTTRTNNTNKCMSITVPAYNTTRRPMQIMSANTRADGNELYIGATYPNTGATKIFFSTAADADTTAHPTRMVIDNQGRVGIGTTNPQAQLHVVGTVQFDSGITISGSPVLTQSAANGLYLTQNQANSAYMPMSPASITAGLVTTNTLEIGSGNSTGEGGNAVIGYDNSIGQWSASNLMAGAGNYVGVDSYNNIVAGDSNSIDDGVYDSISAGANNSVQASSTGTIGTDLVNNQPNQLVIGVFNKHATTSGESARVFTIGNGTTDPGRSNAMVVHKDASMAVGTGVTSNAPAQVVVGKYNDTSTDSGSGSDRKQGVFIVGTGDDSATAQNAMRVVKKNGKTMVLITQSGDISMGDFTTGEKP
jgi:hypothetical protein